MSGPNAGGKTIALKTLGLAALMLRAGLPVPAMEAIARYDWVARILDGVSRRHLEQRQSTSDSIDAVLTHKLWGTLFFIAAMAEALPRC